MSHCVKRDATAGAINALDQRDHGRADRLLRAFSTGRVVGLVTMAGGRPLTAIERDAMHLLAFHAHERCRALAGVSALPVPTAPMAIRELKCLRRVVAGKTDGETAIIMGLSRETVKGHVDSARAKLGARTRP